MTKSFILHFQDITFHILTVFPIKVNSVVLGVLHIPRKGLALDWLLEENLQALGIAGIHGSLGPHQIIYADNVIFW